MGLKQAIVIKSEYTNNARSAPGKGSRGASPGEYVMRYMAREDATEVLAPTRISGQNGDVYDSAAFIRYMARDHATEQLFRKDDEELQDADAYGSPHVLKYKFRKIDQLSGRAFGRGSLSLSHTELHQKSKTIQRAFDEGHSVQKVVISFTEDYLKETGVLDPAFVHRGRGSYKGHVDQLKLREAISKGVAQMLRTGQFVNPEWVATVQLDTSNVHAHLAIVDTEFSKARMKQDGADRGKIHEPEKKAFRKGIHYGLEDMRDLKSFHAQASADRQNVVAFVKDYAYHTLNENTTMQLLVASLPRDPSVWRYGTHRKSMTYPNELVTQIVERVFRHDPIDSGYVRAMAAVRSYARESQQKNKLTPNEMQQVIDRGRLRIIERSVNGLYHMLKSIDPASRRIRTPMTDIQSSSDEELAYAIRQGEPSDDFDPAAFTLRVRGYHKRQDVHVEKVLAFRELASTFDAANEQGFVDDSAHVMRLFYEEELQYHMGLADKYRSFLSFHRGQDEETIQRLTPTYDALVREYEAAQVSGRVSDQKTYMRNLEVYTMDCFRQGVASLREWRGITAYDEQSKVAETRFVLPFAPKLRAETLDQEAFDQVKAWDVHHLGLDYYNKVDVRIDTTNALRFASCFNRRNGRAEAAHYYVASTNQTHPQLQESLRDIADMRGVVDKAVAEGLIQTVTLDQVPSFEERQRFTLPLDHSFDLSQEMRRTLTALDLFENGDENPKEWG